MKKQLLNLAARKACTGIIALFLAMSMLFFLLHSVPGDFADRIAPFAPQEMKEDIVAHWGLTSTIFHQYAMYMKRVFTLSLEPFPGTGNVFDIVRFLLPFTLLLFTAGVVLSYIFGILLSKLLKRLKWKWNLLYTFTGISLIPPFVLGIFLKRLLVFHWRIFPPVSVDVIQTFPSPPWNLYHGAVAKSSVTQAEMFRTVLPGMTLPLVILVVMGTAWVVLAKNGISIPFLESKRLTLTQDCTVLLGNAPVLVYMMGGTLVLEYIFQWPGIGYILFETLKMFNYLLITASIFVLACILIVSIAAADLLQCYFVLRSFCKEDRTEKGKIKTKLKMKESNECTFKKFMKDKKGIIGLSMVLIAFFLAIFAPYLIILDPLSGYAETSYIHHPPCKEYPLGTDVLGRDIYSQVIWGFRHAVTIAVLAAVLVGIIGIMAGLARGLSRVTSIATLVSTTFLVWPQIPLAALIIYSLEGHYYQVAVVAAAACVLWPIPAQAVRAEVSYRLKDTGNSNAFKNFYSAVHVALVYMGTTAAASLVLANTIDFLGMGNPLVISWGQMLSLTMMGRGALAGWWTIVFPGLALTYMGLSFFLISHALKDVLD